MTRRVSNRLAAIPGSATMAIANRAREMAAEGRQVISFAAGEPDFPTPEHILAETARAIYDPVNHHYTANAGLMPLREAIAEYTHINSSTPTDPSQVVVTNGAKQAIYEAFAAILDPGDEVLLPSPYWVTYPASISLSGGTPVPVPTTVDNGFKVTVDDLEKATTPATRALVFVSPSNPTGAVYTAEETHAIGDWAAGKGIWVIADEIYQRLVYDGTPVAPSIAGVTPALEDVILVNGVAKSFAMTGWRVGWLVAPTDIAEAATRHQSHATSNVANVSQRAALAALTGPQESIEEMRQAFDRRRKLMHSGISAIPGVSCIEPMGAFYVYPDVTGILNDRYPTSELLGVGMIEDAGVAVVPGESFGTPGYLRLSYATSDADIESGIERIASMIGSL